MRHAGQAQCTPDMVDAVQLMRDEIRRMARSEVAATRPISRIKTRTEPTDVLKWLAAQTEHQKTYWRDRDGQLEVAGLGVADIVQAEDGPDLQHQLGPVLQRLRTSPRDCRYFGGVGFSWPSASIPASEPHRCPEWAPYGAGRFVLPRLELVACKRETLLACNITADELAAPGIEDILTELASVRLPTEEGGASIPPVQTRVDLPGLPDWTGMVQRALRSFKLESIEKTVLARRSSFGFASRLDPWQLLGGLRQRSADCYLFGIQPTLGTVFIGASPERLYRRSGYSIESEALAGTRRRGKNLDEDLHLNQELLQSEKDKREHRFVVDGLRQTLQSLCVSLSDDDTSVRKLASMQHLYCRFEGRLKPDVDDVALLGALHPTPAVGGYPTALARPQIAKLEPFDRGWYAGPVGWIGNNAADFAVAIRSALIQGKRLMAYAGAGIVEGSSAESEWNELDDKISDLVMVVNSS